MVAYQVLFNFYISSNSTSLFNSAPKPGKSVRLTSPLIGTGSLVNILPNIGTISVALGCKFINSLKGVKVEEIPKLYA